MNWANFVHQRALAPTLEKHAGKNWKNNEQSFSEFVMQSLTGG